VKRAGSNEPVSFAQQRRRQKTAIAAKIPYVEQAPKSFESGRHAFFRMQ
jgi:hypothetical protein